MAIALFLEIQCIIAYRLTYSRSSLCVAHKYSTVYATLKYFKEGKNDENYRNKTGFSLRGPEKGAEILTEKAELSNLKYLDDPGKP